MYKTGVCSVTFRKLSVEVVIELTSKAGLEGIEWGSDIHVPPGEFNQASNVAKLTEQAGLEVVSYGSYYRVGEYEKNKDSFEEILETAVHLKAPSIRVWAGGQGSKKGNENYRQGVVKEARTVATLAEQKNISINLEYHGNTLTDTKESAANLMREIDHPYVNLYWQPAEGQSIKQRLDSIDELIPWLTHVHAFQWTVGDRLPFREGREEWSQYLNQLKNLKANRYILIEFVKEDDENQFLEDAKTLKGLVESYNIN
ncbi:sugar phosphate isomerase/epimerase [Virgibacillus natechei]|uniref:Sugar phosphate isomerase/epimerase n=1 Tax=Virgibacillus natechei TaxID=1216297 RepID=A0ABS4IF62_9BACI|nr:TIM barrel protein [Virgibacillus natechei]MBP1969260.1 sugar phosphate isomerase/epimerase [Virgibacillus natechei]UZD12418.1 sugar phosphate isomerase/epimerase [Virgibacillus natechei]